MTKDSDFKQVVRARMAETGESYTAARSAVEASRSPHDASYDAARAEQEAHWLPGFLAGARRGRVGP